jgi:hypothetical protein
MDTSAGWWETMPVDQFCNLDTIGTSVKFGKIGLTGRTSKVDTAAEMRNQGITKDVDPWSASCRSWFLPPRTTAALSEPAHQFSSKDG